VEALVADLRVAGLDVDLQRHGDLSSVPTGIDLAAYPVRQEALTNAPRHAAGAHVTANEVGGGEDVLVEVQDTGADQPRAVNGSGRRLLEMRERVRLYGGELEAAPDGQGFRVRARIPISHAAGVPG
jgi:signal transduction histidine kinase